jgi:hypothetical protein
MQRIKQLADEIATQHRAVPLASSSSDPSGSSNGSGSNTSGGGGGLAALPPSEAVGAVEAALFGQQRLRLARCGRSALPARALLTHPGTHESAQPAYLNEVRVRQVNVICKASFDTRGRLSIWFVCWLVGQSLAQ